MTQWAKAVFLMVFSASSALLGATEKPKPIRFSPKEIRIELSKQEAQTSGGKNWGKIVILDEPNGLLQVTNIETSPNLMAMAYDLTYRWPNGAKMHGFRVETRSKPVVPVGVRNEWVRISTNHPDFATIDIPVTYHIRSDVRVSPKTLVVNRFLDQEAIKKIRLATSAPAGLQIEQATATDRWLSVRSLQVDRNTLDLEVSVSDPPSIPQGVLPSAITVKIIQPENHQITIPVVLLPRRASDDPRILSVIASSNRLNTELVDSFRCRYTTVFRFQQREIRQTHLYAINGNRERHRIEISEPDRSSEYLYVRNDGQSHGWIGRGVDLVARRPQSFFDAVGGAGAGVIGLLDSLNSKYDKVVSVNEAVTDGRRCVVVGVEQYGATSPESGPDTILTIHFSIEDGFLPVRVDSKTIGGTGGIDTWERTTTVTKILKHPIQGCTFYVPAEFHQETRRNLRLQKTTEYRIDEGAIEINSELPDELFRVEVRPGDSVIDRGLAAAPSQAPVQLSIPGNRDFFTARTGFTNEGGGVMEVKAIFGQEIARFWDGSLKDGTLPAWDAIQLDGDEDDLRNRPVLVCFCDMNQRPSRHGMNLLAEPASELAQKGVVVVVIQTAKTEGDALRVWVEERSVPYMVGTITGEIEKVLSDWGVRSLPWLILADRRHVVQAEGFDVNALVEALSVLSLQQPN